MSEMWRKSVIVGFFEGFLGVGGFEMDPQSDERNSTASPVNLEN